MSKNLSATQNLLAPIVAGELPSTTMVKVAVVKLLLFPRFDMPGESADFLSDVIHWDVRQQFFGRIGKNSSLLE